MMGEDLNRIPQIDAMRNGVDYRFPIKIRAYQLLVRPLSITESIQVAGEVQSDMTTLPKSLQNSLTENSILAKKTLVLASTSDVGRNDPQITDLVLSSMTNDELHFLFKQYVAACDRANPALEVIKAEDLAELVEVLKKSPDKTELAYQLTELSFSQLLSITHYLLTKGD